MSISPLAVLKRLDGLGDDLITKICQCKFCWSHWPDDRSVIERSLEAAHPGRDCGCGQRGASGFGERIPNASMERLRSVQQR